ncbi:hypothetical protein [Bradyrhizobium brasilense]|uniref:Uncharacterized protein n=1 Tax=Bradyrhizobium brasilense TaxID=1419277 RepID=A0ABY8JE30_9BRAD|nr:hypothetical protein [Bradyrhizobium brasilense]WFU62700.1 hypothetical protein QA636_35515 [Bradyrhizobium brasilense]
MVAILSLALIGCLYGYTSHSGFLALLAAAGYGLLGAVVGVPLVVLLNIVRAI